MKKISLFLSAVLLMSTVFAQSKQLVYNLKKGETYRQNVQMDILQKQSVMGQNVEITIHMGVGMASTVSETKPDGYVLSVVYTKMTMNTEIPGMGTVSYDSEEGGVVSAGMEQVSAVLRSMINVPFTMEINKRGELLRVTGLSTLLDKTVAEQGLDGVAQVKASLAQQFNDEAFINQYKQTTCVYPEKALAVGDSWTQQGKINSVMEMDMETTYTVKSISAASLVLEVSSTIAAKEQGMEVQGVPAIANISGTQKGMSTINAATGWVTAGDMEQNMKGEIEVQGMKIPMEMKTTITIDNR